METPIILALIALFSSGGVVYMVIEKAMNRRKDNAETQTTVIHNGNEIAELYNKIDEIVASKLKPIEEELKDIKEHWCCYREGCEMRIVSKSMLNNSDGNY